MKNKLELFGKHDILAAVSGGADSMALLYSLYELFKEGRVKRLEAAHFNHRLRPEADSEQAYVHDFCVSHGIPFHTGFPEKPLGVGEDAARRARYGFLTKISLERSLTTATAHTADDNLETLLLNLARGSGLRGLCGISPERDGIIRPMLNISRDEVVAYLHENQIGHIDDPSNAEDCFSRNRLRHNAVPALKSVNRKAVEASRRTIAALRADENYLSREAHKIVEQAKCFPYGTGIELHVLRSLHPSILPRVFRIMSGGVSLDAKHINTLEALLFSGGAHTRIDLPRGLTASIRNSLDGVWLVIGGQSEENPIWRLSEKTVSFDEWSKNMKIYKKFNSFALNSDTIKGDLTLRTRLPGDTFRMAGRSGTKSLKKLYNEYKIPAIERSSLPVLSDESGIVAIARMGIAHGHAPVQGSPVRIVNITKEDERA